LNEVAAIVINRNTEDYLRECLASLEAQEFSGGISIWVVDNGSRDGSAGMVLSHFPAVNLLWNTRNLGYSRAANQGIEKTYEPYVLVLNSDTVLSTDTVSRVVEFLEKNPRSGVVGPRLLNPDGTLQFSCREFPTVKEAFFHAFIGLFKAENTHSARYKKTDWDHLDEAEVDWVSGAFMALRREAVETVGGFDEKYFMYVEDVDLCWRVWRGGWTVNFLPRGDVMHHVGQSSSGASTRMMFQHHKSMLRFHRKTYRGPMRFLMNTAVFLGIAARFLLIVALNLFYRVRAALGGRGRVIMPGRQ